MSDHNDVVSRYEDLIEQLHAEKEELQLVREETERLHHLFEGLYESAPVGYVVLSPKALILQANATARSFLGPKSVVLGRTALGPMVDSEFQGEYYSALRRAQHGGESQGVVVRTSQHGVPPVFLQLRVAGEFNEEGELLEYRITLEDISERVRAQQEVEELLQHKQLLLDEIHHRVKNDFGLVASFLSLQRSNSQDSNVRTALDEAERRVHTIGHVYGTLHSQEQYGRVDLSLLLHDIATSFVDQFDEGGVSLQLALDSVEVSTRISVTTAILVNELLTNVNKYAADRGADQATVALTDEGNERFELLIADNGPGLPPEVTDGTRLGFGLSIASSLVEQHRGTIEFANRGGAVVTVSMGCN